MTTTSPLDISPDPAFAAGEERSRPALAAEARLRDEDEPVMIASIERSGQVIADIVRVREAEPPASVDAPVTAAVAGGMPLGPIVGGLLLQHFLSRSPSPAAYSRFRDPQPCRATPRHRRHDALRRRDRDPRLSTWVHRYVQAGPHRLMLALGNGAMGFGVPAAVSVANRFPDRAVVAVVGDGGLLMTGNELATARARGRCPPVGAAP